MNITDNKEENENIINEKYYYKFLLIIKNLGIIYIAIFIYTMILLYLLYENNSNKQEIKKLIKYQELLSENKYNLQLNKEENISKKKKLELLNKKSINNSIDIDMIGLKYPEIMFEQIKSDIINNKFISSIIDFLEQLEIKLIYLEKEINATKINAFYTARTLLLKERNIEYDDANINELHSIVSWLVIHRSTQLKGIVSDKYLACKYVKMKLGIDLCQQRIGVYNTVDEIDFKQLIKIGNVILKISNGNHDSTYILKNKEYDIDKLKKKVEKSFYRNFQLIDKVFSHCYTKKRIVLEKMFTPFSDLYEFKFVIVNNDIKVVYVRVYYKNKTHFFYYDSNYNLLSKSKDEIFNILNIKKKILNNLKEYALKLSEDFPNFIRIDLYLFHNNIYLSELTFDHREGKPFLRNNSIIKEAGKNWKRIDCDY